MDAHLHVLFRAYSPAVLGRQRHLQLLTYNNPDCLLVFLDGSVIFTLFDQLIGLDSKWQGEQIARRISSLLELQRIDCHFSRNQEKTPRYLPGYSICAREVSLLYLLCAPSMKFVVN